jgi:hypothetical protein
VGAEEWKTPIRTPTHKQYGDLYINPTIHICCDFDYIYQLMPRSWVKDDFKHILTDSSESWVHGIYDGAVTRRSAIEKAVAEKIETAMLGRNEPVPPELEKV